MSNTNAATDRNPTSAIILAAGLGSRFGGDEDIKPITQLGSGSIIRRNLEALVAGGLKTVTIVVGHRAEVVEGTLREELADVPIETNFVLNAEFRKSNGVSALVGAQNTTAPFVLLMADHVFDAALLESAVRTPAPEDGGVLYVDRKIDAVYDLDDATKVMTDEAGSIIRIGKMLDEYNCVDTGLFVFGDALRRHLAEIYDARGDCSLSDGVQALGKAGLMGTRDVGAALWQDVDTMACLEVAQKTFLKSH
ncbi:MAG: NTP transferase domain-containing protein [Myxococcales bacterium]|nr:NTP transferase domain-containing protein [Myxococcales bacterium]